LLATRQLPRHPRCVSAQIDHTQPLRHPVLDFGGGHAALLQSEGDVLLDIEVGENRVVLENHARIALVGRNVVDDRIADRDRTRRLTVEAGDGTKQRRFSAPARA